MPDFAEYNPNLPSGAPQVNGKAMAAVQRKVISKRVELRESGLEKPATILNFNPIELRVESALFRYTIPPAGKGKTFEFTINKRSVLASYLTVRSSIIRPKIQDVKKPEMAGDDPVPEYDTFFILPIEQAWHFWHEYSEGDAPMGGVLCFEGDIHLLNKLPFRSSDDEDGKDKVEFRIPKFTVLPDRSRTYSAEKVNYSQALIAALQRQRSYCDQVLARAHDMSNDPEQARSITNIDRVWAEFALKQGWIQQVPSWVNATIEQKDVCIGCGAVKKHPTAMFCVCGRPYDAFAAFMAGETVAPSYLVTLPADQRKKVKEEAERRKKLTEELGI